MTARVIVTAPCRGWVGPLESIPDPVFAERMMGDGIAIDPLDMIVRAPCDGRISAIAPTRHSIILTLANGADLLLHFGLETVALNGAGFTIDLAVGAEVRAGDIMMRVDLDRVAKGAKSLITPLVIANEGYSVTMQAVDRIVDVGEPLFIVTAVHQDDQVEANGNNVAAGNLTLSLPHGIHARPAARIAAAMKPFMSEVMIEARERSASARSPVAMLSLGTKKGDQLSLTARGDDARAAIVALIALLESGMDEVESAPIETPSATVQADLPEGVIRGIAASPGLAIGTIIRFDQPTIDIVEPGRGVDTERTALADALSAERAVLAGGDDVAAAHSAMLSDESLNAAADALILQGKSAAFAWRSAIGEQSDALRATGDARTIERISDLRDIEQRVLGRLLGQSAPAFEAPDGAVLVAEDLLPSQFKALTPAKLGAIATEQGGPTSHVAILAAAAGVPMIVAAPGVTAIAEGSRVIVDGHAGWLDPAPDAETLATATAQIEAEAQKRATDQLTAHEICHTADGVRIKIFANLGAPEDSAPSIAAGAEGCGLLRTEFLFLDRTTMPSEDDQYRVYATIAEALGDRPLVIRTLDIGGDKPVSYIPFDHEENPALGLRGIRLSLKRPELLSTQFRAILRAVPSPRCHIMLPMVVDRSEFLAASALLDAAAHELGVARPKMGVMIETPAAALLADSLANVADFLSIGTNDLTQYILATDRGNAALADRIDALHPAVIRAIGLAAQGAGAHGRWLGVCGGLASDPDAAALLIGLGVTELSCTAAAIPAVKAAVRRMEMAGARRLAQAASRAHSPDEVRAIIREHG